MEPNQKKANGLALIPFAVFVGVYLATGITLNAMGVEMAFYQLPTPIASFIGIIVAFAMSKGKFDDKLSVFLHGCGEEKYHDHVYGLFVCRSIYICFFRNGRC